MRHIQNLENIIFYQNERFLATLRAGNKIL